MTARNCDFTRFEPSAASLARRASWFGNSPFGDRRAEQQAGGRNEDDERLQQHECRVQLRLDEGAVAERRRDDCRQRDAEHGGRRAALAEADRRPEQDGNEQIHLAKRRDQCRNVWQLAEERQGAHDGEYGNQRRRLQPVDFATCLRRGAPDQDDRRNEQGTHHVTDPPSAPCVGNPRWWQDAAGVETHDTHRGADQRAQHRGQYDEPDDAGDALERDAEARDLANEHRADERLGRVADTDAERYGHWRADEKAGAERAEEDAGRQAITEQEECGERDPRRQPDDRREARSRIEGEAESGREKINDGQREIECDQAQAMVHGRNTARSCGREVCDFGGLLWPLAPSAWSRRARPFATPDVRKYCWRVISSILSRISALVLLLGGLALRSPPSPLQRSAS
jgi:hypothetical protein